MAHAQATGVSDDPLLAQAARRGIARLLIRVPLEVVYDLGLGPAVRLAAAGTTLSKREIATTADACWRAIAVPT